jgi:hypothetical protein
MRDHDRDVFALAGQRGPSAFEQLLIGTILQHECSTHDDTSVDRYDGVLSL